MQHNFIQYKMYVVGVPALSLSAKGSLAWKMLKTPGLHSWPKTRPDQQYRSHLHTKCNCSLHFFLRWSVGCAWESCLTAKTRHACWGTTVHFMKMNSSHEPGHVNFLFRLSLKYNTPLCDWNTTACTMLTKHCICVASRNQDVNEALVNMVVKDSQPFSVVEDEGFKNLIHVLDPTYTLPTRQVCAAYSHVGNNMTKSWL